MGVGSWVFYTASMFRNPTDWYLGSNTRVEVPLLPPQPALTNAMTPSLILFLRRLRLFSALFSSSASAQSHRCAQLPYALDVYV